VAADTEQLPVVDRRHILAGDDIGVLPDTPIVGVSEKHLDMMGDATAEHIHHDFWHTWREFQLIRGSQSFQTPAGWPDETLKLL
jgi:hypothetical protein